MVILVPIQMIREITYASTNNTQKKKQEAPQAQHNLKTILHCFLLHHVNQLIGKPMDGREATDAFSSFLFRLIGAYDFRWLWLSIINLSAYHRPFLLSPFRVRPNRYGKEKKETATTLIMTNVLPARCATSYES